ncbi:hypothetical protein OKW21_002907 [Catalinimonas alkaloidigena]|uniref:ATP-grasp domain-containing protein n=1 Tax=Catalinimonas alkaloidigena TaxID=1075417 RepID=UPI002406C9B7|nr:ATP-grasp domain-containing protein [Catalinimonas alkaloidigena]MDF9797644.1 hypothetical protein [Catalinimonas alkaloidigena]
MDRKNIFIVGSDEFNMGELKSIEHADQYNFIPLFHINEIQQKEVKPDVRKFMEQARDQLNNFEGSIDAIISFYDFPATLIAFLLTEEYGLRGPSLESGFKCEHKYWSRLEQEKSIPDHIPDFEAVDPFTVNKIEDINLKTPFWIKPIKAYASQLGFKVENEEILEEALPKIREKIKDFGEPFNLLMEKLNMPADIQHINGNYCIAESLIGGHQCTVSGYVQNSEVKTYGIVDSINYEEVPSFFYYKLPSELPEKVQRRLHEVSAKVMKHIGYEDSTFNIEYFYDEDKDQICLLEINPRMSQSHSDLYAKVKGSSNHQLLVKLALGEQPDYKDKEGQYNYSAKFHYRVFEDGIVERLPDQDDIERIYQQYPDTHIKLQVEEGQKLSELPGQDNYSYLLAFIFTGAQTREELEQKYREIVELMHVKIKKL